MTNVNQYTKQCTKQHSTKHLGSSLVEQLFKFSEFNVKQQSDQIKQQLLDNKAAIEQQLADLTAGSIDVQQAKDFLVRMDALELALDCAFAPVRHLNNVAQTAELRSAYQELSVLLSEYSTWLSQNEALYQVLVRISEADYFQNFAPARRADVKRTVRDLRLAGVALVQDKKQQVQAVRQQLTRLTNDFSNHVLDATESWQMHVMDKQELSGLLDAHLDYLTTQAKEKDLPGYLVTLDWPAYHAVMHYADNRELRKQVYIAFSTRASDQGGKPAYDNTQTMQQILALRHQLAQLLGCKNYADYALQTRMADSVGEVMDFLHKLASHSLPKAKRELQQLLDFARQTDPALDKLEHKLEPWDLAYYSEKLRQSEFNLSPEQLRPYFPLENVLQGICTIVERLFAVRLHDITDQVDVYHKDVRFFMLYTEGKPVGGVYLDLFARQGKRDGAWMDEYISRCRLEQKIHLPVAFLATNFTPPTGGKPALLLHQEVETLLHELGHSLHHLLTRVDVPGVAGINHVAWDAVELPSQLMENWCWQKKGLHFLAAHYETREPISRAWLKQLLAAKQFQSGMHTVRQIEFALFDMRIHSEYPAGSSTEVVDAFIMQTLREVRAEVRVTPVHPQDRFPHTFGHIFAGGYAAGYYSYKWAEVLSADIFSRFQEKGIFNRATGESFLVLLLSQGSMQPMKDLFVAFMGREPDIGALLISDGLV